MRPSQGQYIGMVGSYGDAVIDHGAAEESASGCCIQKAQISVVASISCVGAGTPRSPNSRSNVSGLNPDHVWLPLLMT